MEFVLFLFVYSRTAVGISPSQGSYLLAVQHEHTSIRRVGFEATISVFEREKTVNSLDRSATVVGRI
jgi:hypothetical protein